MCGYNHVQDDALGHSGTVTFVTGNASTRNEGCTMAQQNHLNVCAPSCISTWLPHPLREWTSFALRGVRYARGTGHAYLNLLIVNKGSLVQGSQIL